MSESKGQPQCEWFDRDDPSQAPSADVRKAWCDWLNNPKSPFNGFIGNQHAVRRLCRAVFAALGRYDHRCSDFPFALIGPPSTGKATLVRMFVDMLHLPFVELSQNNCLSMTDVASRIAEVCERFDCGDGVTLKLQKLVGDMYMIPPLIVFVDGIHALPKKVEQGLAKAVHGLLATEAGVPFNTSHVCWVVSTTDADLIPDPFDKFTAIHLKPLSSKDIARVVELHNPDLDRDVCDLVAPYVGSPREALAFVKEMRLEFEMNGGEWKDAAEIVARDRLDQTTTPWLNRLKKNSRN